MVLYSVDWSVFMFSILVYICKDFCCERLKGGEDLVNNDTITLHLLSLYEGKYSDKGMNNHMCFPFVMKIHAGIHTL